MFLSKYQIFHFSTDIYYAAVIFHNKEHESTKNNAKTK